MIHHLALVCVLFASPALAQEPHFAFPPASPSVVVVSDVPYGMSGGTTLAMDVFKPPPGSAGAHPPALIFFNGATGADRRQPFYEGWARTAASRGIVAILPDLRSGSQAEDFDQLVGYLTSHRSDLGFEGIAVYAGSGNVYTAFPVVEDPRQTAVLSAVMYYGTGPVERFRLDLPVLYVRAGLDRPPVNSGISALAAAAISQNAPVTLLNHAGGHHAFEMVDATDATRDVIDRTLEFVKRTTSAAYQASLRASLGEAEAAGYVQTGKFRDAAEAYGRMVAARPEDARLRLAYGEALLGDRQYAAACGELDKLRDKGLGYRDLGLPAARACLGKGDLAAAVAWLATIPARFLPASIQEDPDFAALKDRDDFKALFLRR